MPEFRQGQTCTIRVKIVNLMNEQLAPEMHSATVSTPSGQAIQVGVRDLQPEEEEDAEAKAIPASQNKAMAGPPENKALSQAQRERMSQPASRQSPAPQPDTVSSGQAAGLRDQSQSGNPDTATGPQYGDSPANRAAAEEDPFAEPDPKRKPTRRGK